MFNATLSPELAAHLEAGEVRAWTDMYAALPANFARQFGLEMVQLGDVVLTHCKAIPFVHFNCVKNLGLPRPATQALLDEVVSVYKTAGVERFTVYHIPPAQPAQLSEWLEAGGFRQRGGWERIYRDNAPYRPVIETPAGSGVEKVGPANAPEWAAFLDRLYGLPTTTWLLALVERPGWHHYLLRQDKAIVAVRTMHLDQQGIAWLGVEAPVPGLMTPSFDLDAQLCQAIVREGLELGAKYFVADIEAPNPAMNTPAYRHFEALGFRRPYFRSHYTR